MNTPALASIQLTDTQKSRLQTLARAGSLMPEYVDWQTYADLRRLGLARHYGSTGVVVITDVGRDFAAALARQEGSR